MFYLKCYYIIPRNPVYLHSRKTIFTADIIYIYIYIYILYIRSKNKLIFHRMVKPVAMIWDFKYLSVISSVLLILACNAVHHLMQYARRKTLYLEDMMEKMTRMKYCYSDACHGVNHKRRLWLLGLTSVCNFVKEGQFGAVSFKDPKTQCKVITKNNAHANDQTPFPIPHMAWRIRMHACMRWLPIGVYFAIPKLQVIVVKSVI